MFVRMALWGVIMFTIISTPNEAHSGDIYSRCLEKSSTNDDVVKCVSLRDPKILKKVIRIDIWSEFIFYAAARYKVDPYLLAAVINSEPLRGNYSEPSVFTVSSKATRKCQWQMKKYRPFCKTGKCEKVWAAKRKAYRKQGYQCVKLQRELNKKVIAAQRDRWNGYDDEDVDVFYREYPAEWSNFRKGLHFHVRPKKNHILRQYLVRAKYLARSLKAARGNYALAVADYFFGRDATRSILRHGDKTNFDLLRMMQSGKGSNVLQSKWKHVVIVFARNRFYYNWKQGVGKKGRQLWPGTKPRRKICPIQAYVKKKRGKKTYGYRVKPGPTCDSDTLMILSYDAAHDDPNNDRNYLSSYLQGLKEKKSSGDQM